MKWGEIRTVSDEEMAARDAESARLHAEMLAGQCQCKLTGAKPYLMEIEENQIIDLKCAGCGKSVMSEWIESALSSTTDIPVTVTWVQEADDYWTGEHGAFYGEISPRTDGVS